MNIKKLISKVSFSLFIILTFSRCAHINSPAENLKNLEEGKVAAVVTGCHVKYKEDTLLYFGASEKQKSCSTIWVANSGNSFYSYEHYNVNFVSPGTYQFYGFDAKINDYTLSYNGLYSKRDPDYKSMFTDFTVKGGEVIYVGDIMIDTRDTKLVINAVKPIYYNKNIIIKRLEKYPSLIDKLENRLIRTKPEIKAFQKLIPTFG